MREALPFIGSLGTALVVTLGSHGALAQTAPTPQSAEQPTFRSGVDLVSVAAVVRDGRGRIVNKLKRDDFVVIDSGRRREIVDFRADDSAPVSVAVLFDVSGSMRSAVMPAAREMAQHILSWLTPKVDEVALFAFDKRLHELQAFTTDTGAVQQHLSDLEPFGSTSLYDALAETAKRAANRATKRRAVIAITDGVDTSSGLGPWQAAAIASTMDVPVYILAVVLPLDHPGADTAVGAAALDGHGHAATEVARATGGDAFTVSTPSHASVAARRLLAELRHQYLIAFEPAEGAGLHPIDIRVRDKEFTVRTRRGYQTG